MLNIKFINTGLDERIIKSWNPAHPKVYKPVEVHTEHGVLWENRPVNADIPEPVKQHHTKQPDEPGKKPKLHPLLEDFAFPVQGQDSVYEPKISALLNATIHSQSNGKFMDEDEWDEYTVEQMSDMLHNAEKEIDARIQRNQKIMPADVDPLIIKAQFIEGTRTKDTELSQFFNTNVYSELNNGVPTFYVQEVNSTDTTEYTPQELSDVMARVDYVNSSEYFTEQLQAGIHPLIANSSAYPNVLIDQPKISHMIDFETTVQSIFEDNEKLFVIQQKHNPLQDDEFIYANEQELSDLLYDMEESDQQKRDYYQRPADEINKQRQEELNQPFKLLNPATIKHFNMVANVSTRNTGHQYFTGTVSTMDPVKRPSLFADWAKKVLDSQAIESYDRYSYEYDWKMNGYMRGKDYEYYPEMVKDIRVLEQTINQFTLPDNIRVYRILADYNHDLDKFLSEVLTPAGKSDDNRIVIQDKGFASTSVSWEAVQDWKSTYGRLKLVIDVPKGQGRGTYMSPLSKFPKEFEFLLQHGTMFKVLNVDKSNLNMYELHLQVVGCRPDVPDNPPDPNAKSLRKSMRSSHDKHFVAEISDFNIVKL